MLISLQRSVIPACDVDTLEKLKDIVLATCNIAGIGGYKVGAELVLQCGLSAVVGMIHHFSDLPIIYDHQKGATDIPEMGIKFARQIKKAGADAFILFPFSGPATAEAWIKACQDAQLVPIVGGHMTHERFLNSDGGFICDTAPFEIYETAATHGVRDFVVPGDKPEFVQRYRGLLEELIGTDNFALYAPGFIKQGGVISEAGKLAGRRWHAIIGSAIYKAGGMEEMERVARECVAQIA